MIGAIEELSVWVVPAILVGVPLYGYLRGVKVYEAFVEGAEQGFWMSVKLIPYLVAIFVAIAVFRESGAMAAVTGALGPVLRVLAVPPEILPLMIVRPLSGGASFGIAADMIRTYGPDSFLGRLASVMQGSTDTTFYVLTVYFGSVAIRKTRYALPVGLVADAAGFAASILVCRLFFT